MCRKPGETSGRNKLHVRRDSEVPAQLVAAYETAEYRVEVEPPIVLSIGEASAALVDLLAARGLFLCAFITACNPSGQLLAAEENVRRTEALERDLLDFAPEILPARGVDPTGSWPDEPGFLALGCPQKVFEVLGRRHGQNALVLCGADGVPHLVLLR